MRYDIYIYMTLGFKRLTWPEFRTGHLNLSSGEYQNAWNCNTFIPPCLHTACKVHLRPCFLCNFECKKKQLVNKVVICN